MNHRLPSLSRQYQAALRKHLSQGPRASLQPAQGLGRQAMHLGLETLDVARIHEQALVQTFSPGDSPAIRGTMTRRAGTFFIRAVTPIEKTHLTALQTKALLGPLKQTLRQRDLELAASNRQLQQEIAQRKATEKALRKSEQHHGRLLERSRHMQEQLRGLSPCNHTVSAL
jgi:hypothetical protein